MASGGELTDLILRYLVFWFVFRSRSFEEGISMAFDGSENLQKGPRSAQVSLPPLKVGRGRVGIPGNFRVLKVRIAEVSECRERDRLASGVAHVRSVPRCVQGSSRPQADR